MCNEWIMCESGIYPQEDKDGETPDVLILTSGHNMHLAYYYPPEDANEYGYTSAHWENEHDFWPLDKIICWRHKPAPPGLEC